MSLKWVTVATFNTPVEAALSRNYLEAAGVPCMVQDDVLVGMAWHLGNAVGGIKLQVQIDDCDRASALLQQYAALTTRPASGIPHSELAPSTGNGPTGDPRPASHRQRLDLARKTALFGLLFLPLQLYSLWLLLRIVADSVPLTTDDRRGCWITLALNLPVIVISLGGVGWLFNH